MIESSLCWSYSIFKQCCKIKGSCCVIFVTLTATMLKKTRTLKMFCPTHWIIIINLMVFSPSREAFCKRTKTTSFLIWCLKLESIMKRFKVRQCINKDLQRFVYFYLSCICPLRWWRWTIRILIRIAILWRSFLGNWQWKCILQNSCPSRSISCLHVYLK